MFVGWRKLLHFLLNVFVPAWDCSASVRTYALFLEERLECFRVLQYDIESERIPCFGQGSGKVINLYMCELEIK